MLSPGRQELSSSKFLGVPSAITLPNMHWVLGVSGIFFQILSQPFSDEALQMEDHFS